MVLKEDWEALNGLSDVFINKAVKINYNGVYRTAPALKVFFLYSYLITMRPSFNISQITTIYMDLGWNYKTNVFFDGRFMKLLSFHQSPFWQQGTAISTNCYCLKFLSTAARQDSNQLKQCIEHTAGKVEVEKCAAIFF